MMDPNLYFTSTPCTETYVQAPTVCVTVATWGNHEGASILVHGRGPDLHLRMAGAFRWEEIDALIAALAAAKAAL